MYCTRSCRLSFPAANRWNAGVHLRTAGTSRHPESKIPRPPGLRVLWIWELRRVCKPVCLFSNLHHASVTSTITFSFSPFSKKKHAHAHAPPRFRSLSEANVPDDVTTLKATMLRRLRLFGAHPTVAMGTSRAERWQSRTLTGCLKHNPPRSTRCQLASRWVRTRTILTKKLKVAANTTLRWWMFFSFFSSLLLRITVLDFFPHTIPFWFAHMRVLDATVHGGRHGLLEPPDRSLLEPDLECSQ